MAKGITEVIEDFKVLHPLAYERIYQNGAEDFAEWFDEKYDVYQKYYGGDCKVKVATTLRRFEIHRGDDNG